MQIRVQFTQNEDMLTGFTVSGHDEIGADAAFSMLCAAMSSAVMLTCNTLTECFQVPEDAVKIRASKGQRNQIACSIPNATAEQAKILRGQYLHCNALAEAYAAGLSVAVKQM